MGGSVTGRGGRSPLTWEGLVAVLEGEAASPELRRALWACKGREGTSGAERFVLPSPLRSETGSLLLPGLSRPLEGPLAAFASHVLPVWTLLAAGEASSERLLPAVQDPVLAVWGTQGGAPASDPGCRALSIPLLWLGPYSGEDRSVREGGSLTWKLAREKGTAWFVDHLQRAKGRDELAAWVLRRMPPVWRMPSAEVLAGGASTLTIPWRAASEDELRATARRPRAARPPQGGSS